MPINETELGASLTNIRDWNRDNRARLSVVRDLTALALDDCDRIDAECGAIQAQIDAEHVIGP